MKKSTRTLARIVGLVLGLLFLSPLLAAVMASSLAQCPDLFEPNEDFGTALAILPPTPIESYICSVIDVDFFKFSVVAGEEIVVSLTNLPADYDLRLYDPQGAVVEQSFRAGFVSEYVSHTATLAGDYRVEVYGFNGVFDQTFPYRLRVFVGPCPDLSEPNDDFDSASVLGLGSRQGYICTETDQDWYKFGATAGQLITLDLINLPADYDIGLYHPVTRALVTQSTNAGTADEQIIHLPDTTGEYRVVVVGFANAFDRANSYDLWLNLGGASTATPTPTSTATTQAGSPTPTATPTATSTGPAIRYVRRREMTRTMTAATATTPAAPSSAAWTRPA